LFITFSFFFFRIFGQASGGNKNEPVFEIKAQVVGAHEQVKIILYD
jgi:hypothetical protein